jgi:hypothetical protein
MSCLHLNVKFLDWWWSVCTASTDSKSKNIWWEWSVAIEACLGWYEASIMSRSLSTLTSYKSKNIILDWMGDFGCARTSIRGQETLSRERCSIARNIWAVSQYPTHCNADLESARTSMICQDKLQLCYKWVNQCLIFWQKYSISPRLTLLPLGLANMQWSISHMDMDSRLPSAPEL